jgi:glucokinase
VIVLAGDVGGTNIRLALLNVDRKQPHIIDEYRCATASVSSLEDAVRAYLHTCTHTIDAAGFGVAAPVAAQAPVSAYHGPNLPWTVNNSALSAATGLSRVTVVNDFVALGAGIPYLQPTEVLTLHSGAPVRHGPIAVIGAGTGLGEGFLTWNGQRYVVHPSEGGHTTFAPQTALEWRLSTYLHTLFPHVSYERIVSGGGLSLLYQFLVDSEGKIASKSVTAAMQQDDPAAVITRFAANNQDSTCVDTVDLFMTVFGSAAGNLALTVLPTGGVYLAGGVVTHIAKRLQNGQFTRAFMQKGRLQSVLDNFPIHVVRSPHVALVGAGMLATHAVNHEWHDGISRSFA